MSESAEESLLAKNLSRQITRRWRAGDVYAPHDLSAAEMTKWKRRERPTRDVFDVLDFNPMDHYSVCFLLQHAIFRVETGRETGLMW